jgi:hypothetical protein
MSFSLHFSSGDQFAGGSADLVYYRDSTVMNVPATKGLDTAMMRRTFKWIDRNWNWGDTWGWDFPLTAMSATCMGLPDKAVDALLMPVKKNTYLPDGHNYQDDRLRCYLPLPAVGHPVGDVIRYHIRSGKHDITLYDWGQYLDFADHHL